MAVAHFPNSTYVAEKARQFFLKEVFGDPSMSDILTIVPGITNKTQVVTLDRWDKIIKKKRACGTAGDDKVITDREKFWDPQRCQAKIRICEDDFEATVAQYMSATGNKRLEAPEVMNIVLDIYRDALLKDTLRQSWFAEKNCVIHSSGGKLRTNDDQVHYNMYDGLFLRISDAINAGLIKNQAITANAEATFDAQMVLADGVTKATLDKMLRTGDSRLRSNKDTVILMTTELYYNYIDSLTAFEVQSSKEEIMNGFNVLKHNGKTIIEMDIWSRYIKSDFRKDALSYYNPHRIVMAPKGVLQFGCDVMPESQIKMWHSDDTGYNNIESNFIADTQLGDEYLIATAGCE